MKEAKKKILEAKGYKVTDSAEWLGLSKEESQLVEMRVALAQELERVRKAKGITQAELPPLESEAATMSCLLLQTSTFPHQLSR